MSFVGNLLMFPAVKGFWQELSYRKQVAHSGILWKWL